MTEKCEACGRFGAKKGKCKVPMSGSDTMTLYLCDRCDTEQRKWESKGFKREQ